MSGVISEAEAAQLWDYTNQSIALIAGWLNSPAVWTLFFIFLGALVSMSLIVIVINKPLTFLGFTLRD